jgi:hypothetical protein
VDVVLVSYLEFGRGLSYPATISACYIWLDVGCEKASSLSGVSIHAPVGVMPVNNESSNLGEA